jgi:hypothetical protein
MNKFAFSLAFVFAALAFTAPAQAETVNCTPITALPAIITVPGIYCFTGDLTTAMTTGKAIDIQTNDVVIDLNGFKLGGLAAGNGTSAFGIYANNRQYITIKNGTVRGFFVGIFLEGGVVASQGHTVDDVRLDQNTNVGMSVSGPGSIIRNNHVLATGGTTCCGPDFGALGIIVSGNGALVLNNDVIATSKQGTGTSIGIRFYSTFGSFAVNNRISSADVGIEFNTDGFGKYRDNLTYGVVIPFRSVGTGVGTPVGIND